MRIRDIFESFNNIAVYGMSSQIEKAAFTVPSYMKKQEFNIIPINPSVESIIKETAYPDIESVPNFIEVLLVFRPATEAVEIVKKAIERKKAKGDIKVIWLQLGIFNDEAKELAEENSIEFVQDKCMYIEHKAVYA